MKGQDIFRKKVSKLRSIAELRAFYGTRTCIKKKHDNRRYNFVKTDRLTYD